jgi:hypothetical protein
VAVEAATAGEAASTLWASLADSAAKKRCMFFIYCLLLANIIVKIL